MIDFLPEWLKDYRKKKKKLRLRTIIIIFLIFDILMIYISISFTKSENILNKKINGFFLRKQIIYVSSIKKNDNTFNTLKTALNDSLSGYGFEALNVHNNEIEITINLQDTKVLEGLISKIENDSKFKINSIVPYSDSEKLSKYKIGLEAVK